MGAKHTPGEWRAMGRFVWAGETRIASADDVSNKDPATIHNAQLMAAAPDLASALLVLEDRRDPGRFCDHAARPCRRCDQATAALQKAGLR
jgi:hypothetical protein